MTYESYSKYCDTLVSLIQSNELFDKINYIYGVPTGGYPLATHLSKHLNLEMINDEKCLSCIANNQLNDLILICDDIVDTGKTITKLFDKLFDDFYDKHVDKFLIASLTFKEDTELKPDFSVFITKPDEWIVFPWEPANEEMVKGGRAKEI